MNWLNARPTSSTAPDPPPAPPAPDPTPEPLPVKSPLFVAGLWRGSRYASANPSRVGALIDPEFVVEHTTDMHPDGWNALVTAWTMTPGNGACAHFLIGRTPEQGVVQFVPITRNANHAGGTTHGWFVIKGVRSHPNLKAIGIEIHCAGRLRMSDGVWRWGENDGNGWVAKGAAIPDAEVEPITPSTGFHLPTAYQIAMLTRLEFDLAAMLRPLTDRNWLLIPNPPDHWPAWAKPLRPMVPVLGHVHLDPTNREDPGPALCERISKLTWGT